VVRHRSAKPLSPVQIRLPPFHNNKMEHCILHNHAGVAELADALDSKSSAREGVPVRPRPPVSQKKQAQRDGFHLSGLVFWRAWHGVITCGSSSHHHIRFVENSIICAFVAI
jgi:hypothetical protein